MNERDLKKKFREYLQQKWENLKKLDQTTDRFSNDVFNMFLDWLEVHKKYINKSNNWIFWAIVLPQMRNKLEQFWDHFFKKHVYKKYESLFISFMDFAEENTEYVNNLIFDRKKEKLENLVEWQYWKIFNKKAFLQAWHNYIKEDTGKNWDKLRWCLTDIYGYLDVKWLNSLYEIFFDSYEICSKVTSKNNEYKWKENYKKRDAFGEAFSNLESKLLENKLTGFNWEKLSEIKSLFWKYLNFIPKYRDIIFNALDWKTGWWKAVQKDTEASLLSDLSENQKDPEENPETVINGNPKESNDSDWIEVQKQRKQDDFWTEGDWFWPIEIVNSSRDSKKWIYDQTKRWDIIAPIDYWIFPDDDMD